MHVYSKLSLIVLVGLLVFGVSCSNSGTTGLTTTMSVEDCTVGDECSLGGVLSIYRGASGSAGILEMKNQGCVALALPEKIYKTKNQWQNKKVVVRGVAFVYSTEIDIISFEIKDRWVATGACERNLVLYVNEIFRM